MKTKKIFIIIMLMLGIFLTACQETDGPGNVVLDEIAPEINGTKTIYHEIGQPTPNFLAGVSAFDETDGNVTSSIIIDSSSLNLGVEGIYTITYYAFDSAGNTASQTATVNVSGPDVVDLTQPNYPDREYVLPADMPANVALGDPLAQLMTKPPLIQIDYNEAAAKDLTWNTTYNIKLAVQNYSRKTQLGLNVLGSGVAIYVKLVTVSGTLVLEREVASTALWRQEVINIPETQRHLLNQPLELMVYAPKPSTSGQAGTLKISGIWFEGDDEPAVKLEYDPELFVTVYEVDISDFSNQHDGFDDNGIAASGLVTASYDHVTGNVTFTNNGFNDWANMAYRIPDKDSEGNTLALSEVTLIIIEISVSPGAIVKAQNDWNSGDLFEFAEDADGTPQIWILPVSPNGYQAFAAVVLAPSYLREGTASSTIVLHSIKLVKPVDLDS